LKIKERKPGASAAAWPEGVTRHPPIGVDVPASQRRNQRPPGLWRSVEAKPALTLLADATTHLRRRLLPGRHSSGTASRSSAELNTCLTRSQLWAPAAAEPGALISRRAEQLARHLWRRLQRRNSFRWAVKSDTQAVGALVFPIHEPFRVDFMRTRQAARQACART
jgi:hypothetical protein